MKLQQNYQKQLTNALSQRKNNSDKLNYQLIWDFDETDNLKKGPTQAFKF